MFLAAKECVDIKIVRGQSFCVDRYSSSQKKVNKSGFLSIYLNLD